VIYNTEKTLQVLIDKISTMEEVQSIGISGSKKPLPTEGIGDIDIFIYCDKMPLLEKRKSIINELSELLQNSKMNIFQGGHWGTGDFTLINGVETWLMYFTVDETLSDLEAILNGDYPDKLDNYYYPVGRCAMLKDINVLYDKNNFLNSLKIKLSQYPDKLSKILINCHLAELEDIEDLERAVNRKDVLFYHFALDIAIDHLLQTLFAVNKVYFPRRKRTLDFIKNFDIKPMQCSEKLSGVIKLGSCSENINRSYDLWINLVNELKNLCK
jgi:hypothetical protein